MGKMGGAHKKGETMALFVLFLGPAPVSRIFVKFGRILPWIFLEDFSGHFVGGS